MLLIAKWLLCFGFLFSGFAQAASLKQAFSEGKFAGQIRIYNNTLNFQQAKDQFGTAFGGRLAFETKAEHLWGLSAGVGYYTANDLETNKESTARAPFTPTVDVDILGEAFFRYTGYGTVATAGRQLIDTPFANPSDAFTIPVTYDGYSLINKSIQGLSINAYHMTGIKNRQAQDFIDTGRFSIGRLGGTPRDTDGTSILGLIYEIGKLKTQAWHYTFDNLFQMQFAQADYDIDLGGDWTPYVSAQWGIEKETGDKLLGKVDSQLYGLKAGVKAYGANLSFAANKIENQRFLMPYTFFTDATYTNSMISGMGNIAPGTGYKAMLTYDFNPQLWGRLGYSWFDFDGNLDTGETGGDVRYKFSGDLENLQVWFRVGYRNGGTPPAALPDLLEYRTQVQYTF
jgi:hypothetical protein